MTCSVSVSIFTLSALWALLKQRLRVTPGRFLYKKRRVWEMRGETNYEKERSGKNCREIIQRRPNLAFKPDNMALLAGVRRKAGGII